MALKPFNSRSELHVHRQKLPHWRQWGTTYFVTSRLVDSLPVAVAADWRRKREAWLQARGLPFADDLGAFTDEERHEYHREFTATFHRLLDAGHGECVLAKTACADLLIARLVAGHGTAYHLDAWCVMPNHIHVLVEPAEHIALGDIIKLWKGGSAFDINRALSRKGGLWQREPFDHIVRSEEQLRHFRNYIAENPAKAGLSEGYVLGFGSETGLSERVLKGRTRGNQA